MSKVGQLERATKDRIVTLFRDTLGYTYLGDWQDRPDNSNIEENLLRPFLEKQGYDANLIDRAVYVLTKTVWLIDWQNPLDNHFAIAEEVAVSGENNKRPDVVLYVNGIAVGVL